MFNIPTGVILAIIAFFCFVGLVMIILGISLYRRQSSPKNRNYVTQVRRPEYEGPGRADGRAYSEQPEPENQPFVGSVQRSSGPMVPTEIGNLFNNIVPPQLSPNILQSKEPILPADVSKKLEAAMLNGRNHLEDVNYGKIVPNFFVVEVSPDNYQQNYEPIERQACEQWQQRLLNAINTANSRQGRKVFRFGGPVKVNVRPVPDLNEKEVRILSQIRSEAVGDGQSQTAYLERLPDGRRWYVQSGTTTLGRSSRSDIYLDSPTIQERRLISNQHAYIRADNGRFYIYDGTIDGKRSRNGTFVNGRGVTDSGYKLSDGDVVILAALDYDHPRPDYPGSVGFIFHTE
jgi:hypothetical protein